MTKLALLVGIDNYPEEVKPLPGCVNDAKRMCKLLACHDEDKSNFECIELVAPEDCVTEATLKKAVNNLFEKQVDVALFYFSGHGTVNNLGGYLVTQDAKEYDPGLSMTDVLTMANNSPARERIILLDCCHSGALGHLPALYKDAAVIREGVAILSASRESEAAVQQGGGGLFTSLVCEALEGGAADVLGNVNTAGIYSYVNERLGGWEQRPLFINHVSELVPLRKCPPAVDPKILRLLPKYFKNPYMEYPLHPSYEPTAEPHNPEHEEIFGHLQKMRAARLVVPVGEEHMYYAAMNQKSCKLTALGIHVWHLANKGKFGQLDN